MPLQNLLKEHQAIGSRDSTNAQDFAMSHSLATIALNNTLVIRSLLPYCTRTPHEMMLIKVNSPESALLIVDFFVKQGFPVCVNKEVALSEFTHRLGLNGHPSDDVLSNQFLLYVVEKYANHLRTDEDFNTILIALRKTVLLDGLRQSRQEQLYKQCTYKYYLQGLPLILGAGWALHGVGLSILWDEKSNKTYVSFSNRGTGGITACLKDKNQHPGEIKSGTVLYEFPGILEENFFSAFEIGGNQGIFRYSQVAFEADIQKYLQDATAFPLLLEAAPQGYGTCSYVNTKQAVRGLLCILRMAQGVTFSPGLISDMTRLYKDFSIYDKNLACSELIKSYQILSGSSESRKIWLIKEYTYIITRLLLAHSHSNKPENVERMRSLLAVLSPEIQENLVYVLPSQITTSNTSTSGEPGFFKPAIAPTPNGPYDFKLSIDSVDNMMAWMQDICSLMHLFASKGYTKNEVVEIVLEKQNIHIHTKTEREVKYRLRALFPSEYVQNVDGQYKFILKIFSIMLQEMHNPQENNLRMLKTLN